MSSINSTRPLMSFCMPAAVLVSPQWLESVLATSCFLVLSIIRDQIKTGLVGLQYASVLLKVDKNHV